VPAARLVPRRRRYSGDPVPDVRRLGRVLPAARRNPGPPGTGHPRTDEPHSVDSADDPGDDTTLDSGDDAPGRATDHRADDDRTDYRALTDRALTDRGRPGPDPIGRTESCAVHDHGFSARTVGDPTPCLHDDTSTVAGRHSHSAANDVLSVAPATASGR
jgi:hypothetical protein